VSSRSDTFCAEVFHFEEFGHGTVTNFLGFSGICQGYENLLFKINDLMFCLFFRQLSETGRKQGKLRHAKNFPAELSTESVDSFPLALVPSPLQPRGGINESLIQV
jgi:hypothetical protein